MIEIPATNLKITVTIKSPLAILYKGSVAAITLINEKGNLDILPLHANFISLIKDVITIYETPTQMKEIKIEEGIAKVFENNVDIFVGIKSIS